MLITNTLQVIHRIYVQPIIPTLGIRIRIEQTRSAFTRIKSRFSYQGINLNYTKNTTAETLCTICAILGDRDKNSL